MRVFVVIVCMLGWALAVRAQEEPKVPFIDQTLQRSEDFYSGGMKSLVEDVIKVTGLNDQAKIADMRKAAEGAVRDKMDKSKVGLWKTWHEMQRDGEVDQLQFWASYRKLPEAILTPDRSPIWTEALKQLLSGPELEKWSTEENKRRARIEKAIQDYLTRGREQWKAQRVENRKAQAEELITTSKLDATVAAGVREGIEAAVTKSLGSWGNALEKQIRDYVKSAFLGGAEDRIQQLEGGAINFGNSAEPDAVAAEDVAWHDLLKAKLTPDSFAVFEVQEKQRLDRRVRAMAMLAVAELDRKLRLTDVQRSKLELLLTEVVRGGKSKIDAMLSQSYANSEIVLMVCNGVKEPEVKALLEADQFEVWREVAARYSSWWNQF